MSDERKNRTVKGKKRKLIPEQFGAELKQERRKKREEKEREMTHTRGFRMRFPTTAYTIFKSAYKYIYIYIYIYTVSRESNSRILAGTSL